MLNAMREGAKSGVSKFILFGFMVMAVGGLVFMDIGGFFRGGVTRTAVAKIGKQELPITVFDRKLQRILNQQGLDVKTAYQLGFVQQVLNNEISNNVIQHAASDLGLEVGEKVVLKQVNKLISPLVTENVTKKQALSNVLRSQGLTERGFIEMVKAEMTNTLLRNALQIGTEFEPRQEAIDLYLHKNEKRTIKTVYMPHDTIEDIEYPVDEILLPLYQTGQERYAIPETRSFSIAILSQDALAKTMDISDEELMQIYERDIAGYEKPEQRKLVQAVFDSQVKAGNVAAMVRQGTSVKEAVKKETGSEDAYLGEENFEKEGLLEEIGDAAFAAGKGDVIGPVETALGWHVLKLTEIVAPKTEPFEKVKDKLKKEIIQLRLVDEMYALANNIDDSIAGGMSLEDVAAQMDMEVKTYGPVKNDGSTPDEKDGIKDFGDDGNYVLETVFDLLEGEISPVIELSGGRYAAIRVDKITDKTYKPFEDVKKDIAKIWIDDQKQVANKLRAQDYVNALNAGEKSFSEIAAANNTSVKTYDIVRAEDPPAPLDNNAKGLFFLMPEGEYVLGRTSEGIIIGQITDVTLPDVSKLKDDDLEPFVQSAGRAAQNEFMQMYFAHLQDQYDVKINQRLLETTYGPGSEQF